ncbi:MAG TPA: hypothetical protein VK698_28905 [Kofleriaceae bacterium]|nr:hypothetical protein [Kofleriaceae bacterium]
MSEPRGPLARLAGWLWAENLALALAAIAAGAGELLLVRALYLAGFGGQRRIAESTDLPLAHAVLWLAGLACAGLAGAAAYRLVRRGRWWVAAILVPLICFPLLVLGLGSLYGSLIAGAVL